MTQVVVILPGTTVYDEQGRIQGVLDLPLNDQGLLEASSLAEHLPPALELVALYCGPGDSACQTAEAIGRAYGLRLRRLEELRNLDCGLWQGLQVQEVKRRNPKLFRQWIEEPRTICPPEGETVEEALERIRDALKPLLRRHRDQTFAIVTSAPLAQLLSSFLKKDADFQITEQVAPCSYEIIDVDPDQFRNGDSHLP